MIYRHLQLTIAITLLTCQHVFGAGTLEPLPEGHNGLAAKYPGDAGITNYAAVIFADDFEGHRSKAELSKKWNSVYNQTLLTQDTDNVFQGKQALEFRVPENRVMASGAARYFLESKLHQDVLFLRYYSKFAKNYDVLGGAHTGGGISAQMYKLGRSSNGVKANGKNHFFVMLDHGRLRELPVANPGYLGIYVYHLDQRHRWGDAFFPDGMVIPNSSEPGDFGPNFVSRTNIVTKLDTWHCHEVMLKANTPGERDGRVAAWVNGRLAMDFPNLHFRDIDSLKIDHIQIGLNINTKEHPATKKWYDNVVAATSYIGPVTGDRD